MTLVKNLLIGVSLFATPTLALANFSSSQLLEATRIALVDFEANNAHAEHFTGYKAWKSGIDAKVKIYVDHGGMAMEYDYLCQKYEDGEETTLECLAD